MPIKLKYPSKPDFYDLTVGDLLAMLTDVPHDTLVEFRKFPTEAEKLHVSKVYLKSFTPLLSDKLDDINAITFVLF